jgi:uncharacterized protein YeaO (DUF488 family)
MKVQTKRIYEPAARGDGFRVLVDRVWPRGIRKEDAHLDLWLKEIAPSTKLRQWFGHKAEHWKGFRTEYRKELRKNPERVRELLASAKGRPITLLHAARDIQHTNAVVLAEYLLALDDRGTGPLEDQRDR